MKHKLELRAGSYYLHGQMLMVIYPAGDCDVIGPKSKRKYMHQALYDTYQCSEILKDGDTIAFPNGRKLARCEGVHVVLEV